MTILTNAMKLSPQNNTVLHEIASRFDNGNSTPEFLKDTEPARESEDAYSVRDEGLIPDHIEEPLRDYAEQARRDSVQEQEIEDIPLEEDVKEEVADALGDNGVPLEEKSTTNKTVQSAVCGCHASRMITLCMVPLLLLLLHYI